MAEWTYMPLTTMLEPRGLLCRLRAACRWAYFRNPDYRRFSLNDRCTFVRIFGWQRVYPAATKEGDTHAD